MAHHLVLFLGTGALRPESAESDAREGRYRLTRYALADGAGRFTSRAEETPFVGEAILKLAPGRFTHVHVFGTAQSMWDSLAERLGGDYVGLAVDLIDSQRAGSLRDGNPLLVALSEAVGAAYGAHVTCGVLPPPDTEAHTWTMLERLAALDGLADGDTLSLDVTHGLRVQPLFMLLAARYLQAVRSRVALGHVFYGAYDFRRPMGEGPPVSPILDLQAHVALLDWIDAALAFDRYADAEPIAALLERSATDGAASAATRAKAFSRQVQVNTATGIGRAASRLLDALDKFDAEAPTVFTLVRPSLQALPDRVAEQNSEWQRLLVLARHHWEHGRAGLAVLAAYESIIARLALLYDKPLNDRKNHAALGKAAWKAREFRHVIRWRHGIAHTRANLGPTQTFQFVEVYQNFANTLSMLERELGDGGQVQWLRREVNPDSL